MYRQGYHSWSGRKVMKQGDKVGIVCCSNGLNRNRGSDVEKLVRILTEIGITSVISNHIYTKSAVFSGTGTERAQALMRFYADDDIKVIFDISGGDIANEILPYLDFELIREHPKQFWGYSDLTTILNAVYTKTGNTGVLYQVMNLVWDESGVQRKNFADTILGGEDSLFSFPFQFVQGDHMEGIVTGGNIRCLLKLAGTEFFPDMRDKLLVLEALGGSLPQFVTYLSQLKCMGVFAQIKGIVLGTFTQMEAENIRPDITTLVQKYAGDLPIVKTSRLGHGVDSCGVVIGAYKVFDNVDF